MKVGDQKIWQLTRHYKNITIVIMSRAILQIPIDPSLRIAAEKIAAEQGFSSLQEAVRVFLKQLAQKSLTISFNTKIELSAKAVTRYNKMVEDIRSGKVKTKKFDNTSEMVKYLNEC